MLGTDRIKILGTVGFEFEQDAIQKVLDKNIVALEKQLAEKEAAILKV